MSLPALTVGHAPTVPVYLLDGAVCFVSGMAIDVDGAPRAYCVADSAQGLDNLANAYEQRSDGARRWFGVLTDPAGEPIVDADGFGISTTSLVDVTQPVGDRRRYFDSSLHPGISIPPQLRSLGVRMGDVAIALNRINGQSCSAVVFDSGPSSRIGEGSPALARALGIPDSARNGGTSHGVCYLVFPGTAGAPPWPRSDEDVAQDALARLVAWGGLQRLLRAVV